MNKMNKKNQIKLFKFNKFIYSFKLKGLELGLPRFQGN